MTNEKKKAEVVQLFGTPKTDISDKEIRALWNYLSQSAMSNIGRVNNLPRSEHSDSEK